VGLLGRGISPVTRPLLTEHSMNTNEMRIFVPRVGLEPKIPMFQWAKTFHALDHVAHAIGRWLVYIVYIEYVKKNYVSLSLLLSVYLFSLINFHNVAPFFLV
jgi:hypothetical protein